MLFLTKAPQDWIAKYDWVADIQRRNLSAMVGIMDQAAGNVTDALKSVGLWHDTIFVVSFDLAGNLVMLI